MIFVQKTASWVAKQGSNACCVVLAPRLLARGRESLQQVLRDRDDLTAAVFDDLDLCRLLNPGGEQPNLLIGLLEIILEQQRKHQTWQRIVDRRDSFGRGERVGQRLLPAELPSVASHGVGLRFIWRVFKIPTARPDSQPRPPCYRCHPECPG